MLNKFGFVESKEKKDLFYKNLDNKIILFFDFRARDLYGHCQNLFYFKINKELTEEEESYFNKIIINEFFNVVKKIKKPVDFEALKDCDICNKKYCFGYYEKDNDFFMCCSKSCYKIAEKENNKFRRNEEEEKIRSNLMILRIRDKVKCAICREKLNLNSRQDGTLYLIDNRVDHHINYNEGQEDVVSICPSCHTKITFHLDKYPELKKYQPIGSRDDMLERIRLDQKIKMDEKVKERKQKEFQKLKIKKGMGGHSFVKYDPGKLKSPMLGAWLK